MTALAAPDNPWGRIAPLYETRRIAPWRTVDEVPYAPDAWHLFRFWIAGPLTLLLFVPALGAGLFGAPMMLPGLYLAWRMLRSGQDSAYDFAYGGFQMGLLALICSLPFGLGILFLFGLLFGPLMGMCFRWIAGDWREEPRGMAVRGKPVTAAAVSPSPAMPPLARIPRTQ